MKKIRRAFTFALILLLFGLSKGCSSSDYPKEEEQTLLTPTPKAPDAAPLLLYMNGEIYWVQPLAENLVAYEEKDLVGTVTSKVAYNVGPTKDWESNCLPVGTLIYKDRHMKGAYVCTYHKSNKDYYYRCTLLSDN